MHRTLTAILVLHARDCKLLDIQTNLASFTYSYQLAIDIAACAGYFPCAAVHGCIYVYLAT